MLLLNDSDPQSKQKCIVSREWLVVPNKDTVGRHFYSTFETVLRSQGRVRPLILCGLRPSCSFIFAICTRNGTISYVGPNKPHTKACSVVAPALGRFVEV